MSSTARASCATSTISPSLPRVLSRGFLERLQLHHATSGVKADNTFLVYQDTYIMGDPGWFMGSTEVEVPEKYFTVK